MKMKKKLPGFCLPVCHKLMAAIALLVVLSYTAYAQTNTEKGLPFIDNYRYQDYNADGVNWWAAEDDKGLMYFANNLGVLVFDGKRWETIKVAGITETRSLAKGKDGKIYVGTNGNIGYLQPGKKGSLQFISLLDKLPQQRRTFSEVWETSVINGNVYFRTNNQLFIWDYKTLHVIESKANLHVGAEVNNEYYCRIWGRGLCVLKNDSFYVVHNGERFANERIYVMLPYDDKRMLIGTRTMGLFLYDGNDFTPFKTEADPFIVNTSLYGGRILSNGLIALNTFNDGMAIIDKQGRLVQRIDKSVGLQDNSVDHVFEDSKGNLWLSLFNGIAKFNLHSSFTFYNETLGLPAKTVFAVGVDKGNIYAGTNNGVYILNNHTNRFEIIPGTSGQVGNFIHMGNDFIAAGAEKGLLKITGATAIPVIPSINYNFHVGFVFKSKIDSNVVYCGLRSGLAIVRHNQSNGSYTVDSYGDGLVTPVYLFAENNDGTLWVAGDNIGELKLVKPEKKDGKLIITDHSFDVYNYKQGLPYKTIGITNYDDTLYFASAKDSIFKFNEKQHRFIQDSTVYFKNYVTDGDGSTDSPKDAWGRIWTNFGTGVFVKLPTKDGSIKIVDAPFKELGKNYPVWGITPSVDNNGHSVVWLSGREGIIRYDGDLTETSNTSFNTIIRSIKLNEDSVYYSGFSLPAEKAEFTHQWNSVRFQYAAPFFTKESDVVFSTYLEGNDKNWSEWSKQGFRDYGNLSAGTYTFHVKAKNIYDVESKEAVYTFIILHPWYSTWWAYLLYVLIAVITVYFIVGWRTKHLHELQRELEKTVTSRTKELSMRVEELAVINSVQSGLVSEMGMQAIYNLVGERVKELFQTHAVMIAGFDLTNKVEHFNYVFENGERLMLESRPINHLRQLLIDGKKTIYIETEETARNEYGITAIGNTIMPKSFLFVPWGGNVVKGYISIQNIEKEHAFNESDIRLLETVANSMSVALENARLFDETRQRASELATVNSVSQALASQVNADEIIKLAGDQMKDLFNANIVYLALLDKKTKLIHFAYQYGDNMPSQKLGEGLTSQILLKGKSLLINKDVGVTTTELGLNRMGRAAASYLGVPIMAGDEIIGVLSVQSTEAENRFNADNERLLSTIAASVGVAINKAQLFDEVNQAKQQAERAGKAAEKANEAKSAFLSTVSHELRTPLTSVLGFAKIIRKRLEEKIFPIVDTTDTKTEKTISQISENLQVVISEGERLTHLINDVLDLAKIEAGKMEWNQENVSMAEVGERALAATTTLFDQKNLQIIREIEPDLPEIVGDRDKLIQVVINLISNAVKFTDAGSITCRMQQKNNELVVSIIDTGIGIKSEDFGAVFEQFKQVGGDTLTDKPKGTGLGLPICKEIVEHHGGHIWLESEVGKGSTFSFAIPITKSDIIKEQPIHLNDLVKQLRQQMLFSSIKMDGKNATILIVDDDDSIRSLLRQELSDAGYITEEASNGKEALQSIRNHRPDLVILDIMMPEINGFDVAAILKNDPQTMDIPIIVLSIVQDKSRGFRIGVDRYLTKPIDTTQLFTDVGTLLEQGKSKKKVMVVDEDNMAVRTLTDVLLAKGYHVVESDGSQLVEKAIENQPDIIIVNSMLTDKTEIVQTLRFEKGLENVLFFIYQ
jgi:signal transduction histidine kinase/CheY-like chemotaxis protein